MYYYATKMGKIQVNQGGKHKMNVKKQDGVTLLVLVITIIVILIIVGTSVGTIVSRQGLLKSQIKRRNDTCKMER